MRIFDKERNSGCLTGISDFSLNHTISPFTKYTITQVKDKTTLNGNWQLFKNQNHYLSIFTLMNIDTCEKSMSCGLKTHLRYHFNNHTMISAGIEDYHHEKGKIPNLVSIYALHGYGLENGLNIYGGLYTGYLIKEKMLHFQKYLISIKNSTFNSLLSLNLNKQEQKEGSPGFDKTISFKIFNMVSNCLTVGGDIECNINKHTLAHRLFTNYQLDQDTLLKTKWEDNDKSFILTLNHNFRGLFRFGVTGKINILRNNPSQCKCPMPKIKTKFGLFAEIDETFI